jgi:hypothetical protein
MGGRWCVVCGCSVLQCSSNVCVRACVCVCMHCGFQKTKNREARAKAQHASNLAAGPGL